MGTALLLLAGLLAACRIHGVLSTFGEGLVSKKQMQHLAAHLNPDQVLEDFHLDTDWDRWLLSLKRPTHADGGAGSGAELVGALCTASSRSSLSCRCALRGDGHGRSGAPFVALRCSKAALVPLLLEYEALLDVLEPDVPVHLVPPVKVEMEAEAKAEAEAKSWGLERVGVPAAAAAGQNGNGVHIYHLDTGIRKTHQDFEGRAIPTLDYGMQKDAVVTCTSDIPKCANDTHGHGTHTAGTAIGHEYGVAKKAMLHAIKVLGDDGTGALSWTVHALDWVGQEHSRTKGPSVVTMSLGEKGRFKTLKTAVDSLTDAGVTVVVAAGNENDDAMKYSPAFIANAIAVGASTSSNERAWYSNYGKALELFAPGSIITSASCHSNTGAAILSGTSMATPHVTGAVAILLQQHPNWTSAEVRARIGKNATRGVLSKLKEEDPNRLLFIPALDTGNTSSNTSDNASSGSPSEPPPSSGDSPSPSPADGDKKHDKSPVDDKPDPSDGEDTDPHTNSAVWDRTQRLLMVIGVVLTLGGSALWAYILFVSRRRRVLQVQLDSPVELVASAA